MYKKFLKSVGYALNGLKTIWEEEDNFKIEITLGFLAIILGYVLQIGPAKGLVLILTITFVLAIESLNTALEELCDKEKSEHDPHIGKIKDLAAAAVLIASVGAFIIGIMIFVPSFLT